MDYEKLYKEALERAKSKITYNDLPCHVDVFEIFPELKESEDERVVKELLNIVRGMTDEEWLKYSIDKSEAEEWLKRNYPRPSCMSATTFGNSDITTVTEAELWKKAL